MKLKKGDEKTHKIVTGISKAPEVPGVPKAPEAPEVSA